jgi:hypothetical protein
VLLSSPQRHSSNFGFNPREKVTVLLKDFADYGNASAGGAATLLVDIAPISFTYETFAPSERMYTLMNHELVHVAMMDSRVRDRTARWLRDTSHPDRSTRRRSCTRT